VPRYSHYALKGKLHFKSSHGLRVNAKTKPEPLNPILFIQKQNQVMVNIFVFIIAATFHTIHLDILFILYMWKNKNQSLTYYSIASNNDETNDCAHSRKVPRY